MFMPFILSCIDCRRVVTAHFILGPSPIVNRGFPKSGRAALAPDGLRCASFEANELFFSVVISAMVRLEHRPVLIPAVR